MVTNPFKHELGSVVESKVTGVTGTIISRSENLYGCNRYHIQPRVMADGKVPDGWWIDEMDMIVKSTPIKEEPKEEPTAKRGGPMSKLY